MTKLKIVLSGVSIFLILLLIYKKQTNMEQPFTSDNVSGDQTLFDTAVQAYIYAYPLVLMDVTKKTMTGNGQYINRFINISEFPDDTFKHIVRPNVDTLYSFAWIDLTQGPLLLTVPDTHGRYYLIEFLDAWTNVFASVGKRTTGTTAQKFIIVGPRDALSFGNESCKDVAGGCTKIQAPTNMILLLGRTQTYGINDYHAVHEIQAGYQLVPWQQRGDGRAHSLEVSNLNIGTQPAPVDQVAAMDMEMFYSTFAHALKNNSPAQADELMVSKLQTMGIEPGKDFDRQALSADVVRALTDSIKTAYTKIVSQKNAEPTVNGWAMMLNVGVYGINYLTRAMVACIGIGANLPSDAVYPTTFVDGRGNPLRGTHNYRLHFDVGQLPPAHAFWSITLYNSESFLVKNPINRYSLNDRDPLQFNSDGSLDIYIQHELPSKDKVANWLPSPEDYFNLTLRLYWPDQSVLDGTWQPPAVEKII